MSAKPKPSVGEELDSQRCRTCNTTSKRSLVVCIDGTSNQFSIRNTNVVELYSRLIKDENQRTFYNSGIGTYAKPHGLTFSQWITNKLDLAFAWEFDKVLLSAYQWLSENYEPGDRIFLFGFSRGAYQVRALSAMIRDVGLIHKGNQAQIPFAYQLYANPNSREVSKKALSTYESVRSYLYYLAGWKYHLKDEPVNLADRFKTAFSRQDVRVHFVGVWDTVSSVGLVYGKTLPGTTDGMEHACFFRHALAVHERRVKFLPEFAGPSAFNLSDFGDTFKTGGSSKAAKTTEGYRTRGGADAQHNSLSDGLQDNEAPSLPEEPSDSNNVRSETQTLPSTDDLPGHRKLRRNVLKKDTTLDALQGEPSVKEVWFAGSHSDIGGGNETNLDLDRFGPSMRWMSNESRLAGLKLGDDPRKWEGNCDLLKPYESLTWAWWFLEVLPVKRLSFLDPYKRDCTVRWPHLGQWRRAFYGQKLHETALEVIGLDRLPPTAAKHLWEIRKRDGNLWGARQQEKDEEVDRESAPNEPVQGDAPAPPLRSDDHTYGPDWKFGADLDVESDPYQDTISFFGRLERRGLTYESDVERLENLLANEAGRNAIRDTIHKLIDMHVMHITDTNYNRYEYPNKHREKEHREKEKLEASRGTVLSEWGSRLLRILKEWDEAGSAHPACDRALRAVFRLFIHVEPRLSFPDSCELRRLAKSFATRRSDFLLLVNSVRPAVLASPLRGSNDSAVFHPDGKRVIVGSTIANHCLVLDYSDPFPPRRLVTYAPVYELAVSGDGVFIGVALAPPRETVLTIWDAASPGDEPIHTVEEAPAPLRCLAFNHAGTRLVAGCSNGAIIVWTKAEGPVWSQFASFPDDPIWNISWSRDSNVAAGSSNGFLSVWHMGTASTPTELLPRTKVGSCVDCLAFAPTTTPDSSPILIVTGGCAYPEPAHWQLGVVEDGVYRPLGHLMGDNTDSYPTCLEFSPDGNYIASGLFPGKVRIWNAGSREPVCDDIYIPGEPDVLALSFESDDTAVKAVCDDGLVRLLCWK